MGPLRPFVGEPTWLRVCDDAPLRVPIEESEEETEGLCLCETLKKPLQQRPGPSNTLLYSPLYSTLLWTPSRAPLAASMDALFCGGTR